MKALAKKKHSPVNKKRLSISFSTAGFSIRGALLTYAVPGKRERVLLDYSKYTYSDHIREKGKPVHMIIKKEGTNWFACVCYRIPEPQPTTCVGTIGIDRGIKTIAATSEKKLYGSTHLTKIKRKYNFLRRVLQKKGTRSAKRKLRTIRNRETRFVRNTLHTITKQISRLPYGTFALETLKKLKRNKNTDTKKSKGCRFNRMISNWSYYLFEQLLTYKLEDHGKAIKYIDPRYTSQKCHSCGKILKSNRKGSFYKCKCGYHNHADINAALNIQSLAISKEQGIVNYP